MHACVVYGNINLHIFIRNYQEILVIDKSSFDIYVFICFLLE